MKSTIALALVTSLVTLVTLVSLALRPAVPVGPVTLASSPTPPLETHASTPPVAVVELFTSEGCSSCPPADQLLLNLAERGGEEVIVLAFHVDYWNRLGWRDPFSDAAYSQRQRAYARTFESGRVYTPQMIVNGRREFVGSRRHEAEGAIRQALGQPAAATVALQPEVSQETVTVDYAVEGAPDGAVLHLALVQRRAEQAVPRGENKGRTLRHVNVVRDLQTVAAGAGHHELTLPDGLALENAAIIGYVQHPETMHIAGAAQVRLVPLD